MNWEIIVQSFYFCLQLEFKLNSHQFGSMEEVQSEISPKIREMSLGVKEKIPFLATDEGIGKRNVISTFKMKDGSQAFVEEVVQNSQKFRRLVFESNSNLIQSEVRLDKVKFSR